MEKKEVLETVKSVKENSPKRNFKQTVDLIINLKNLDLKKPDNHIDAFINLNYPRHKKPKICGLVGAELVDQSRENFDKTLTVDEFPNLSKREAKKMGREYDYFVAQANLMTKIAQNFGKILGPLGKMPNPKAGCVVPANANLAQLRERLNTMVRLKVKTHLALQIPVGYEDTDDEIIADSSVIIHNQLLHLLPLEQNNIKDAMLKLTMGKPFKIGN